MPTGLYPGTNRRPQGWPRVDPQHPQLAPAFTASGDRASTVLDCAVWPMGAESVGKAFDLGMPGGQDATLNSGAIIAGDEVMSAAMGFAAAGSYCEVTTAWPGGAFDPPHATVSFWFRTAQSSGNNTLVARATSGTKNGWHSYIGATGVVNFQGYANTGGTFGCASAAGFNDGAWHHVCCTYSQVSGETSTLYVDGVLAQALTVSGSWSAAAANPIRWALSTDAFWQHFTGQITDTRFVAGWLSPAMIAEEAAPRTRWAIYQPPRARPPLRFSRAYAAALLPMM